MKMTVVALMCHSLGTIPQPVCREEIVTQDDMPMQACILSQAAVADWKSGSNFRSDKWYVAGIRCVQGDYQPKEAT